MQVENSSAYTSPLFTRAAHGAENKGGEWASTPAPAQNGETDIANTAKAAPVTGVTGSNLSKEVVGQLIAEAQEIGVSNANTEEYDGPLSIGERHHLEDIANDPVYAASQAKLFGTSGEMYFVKEIPTNSRAVAAARSQREGIEAVQQQRTAYYENLTAQDLPPAEIYFNLLEFNANLPKSHDDTMEWSASRRAGGPSYSDYNQARSDYLQNLISQEKSASASAKDVDPVETT